MPGKRKRKEEEKGTPEEGEQDGERCFLTIDIIM